MIRANHRRRSGGRGGGRVPTAFVWTAPAPSASPWPQQGESRYGGVFPGPAPTPPPPPWPRQGASRHGRVFSGPAPTLSPPPWPQQGAYGVVLRRSSPSPRPPLTPYVDLGLSLPARLGAGTVTMIRANHQRRKGGRGGGRAPTVPWPHQGASRHGGVFAGPALTPSCLYAPSPTPSPTPSPATASSQVGHPAAEKVPDFDLASVSKKGHAQAARPGSGTVGTNHFLDVSINPESKSREVLSELIKLHGKTSLGGKLPAYDGTKSLYTAGPLPFGSEEFTVTLVYPEKRDKERAEREYNLTIRIAGRTDLFHLQQFLFGRQKDMPEETFQVLDIILRESPSWKFPVDERGTRLTVVQYFKGRYNLQYTTWPCLQSGSTSQPVYLPMEAHKIVEWQSCSKLNDKQITNILTTTCQRPQQREESISEGTSRPTHCHVIYDDENHLTEDAFQSITNNLYYIYGRWTRAASDVKFTPAIPNSSQPVREVTISSSPSSNRMIGTSKIQVIFRIGNFGSFPMQFEDTCTIQHIVSAAFQKQNINISDAVIRFNSRSAYLEDTLCYLNTNNDKECSLYIGPRLRGGQPPSSSIAPATVSFEQYMSTLGDELFDVVTFPPDPALYFIGMDQYFISLGLKAIEIAKMFFELLETYHEKQECVLNFTLADLEYDTTSNKLMFRGTVRTATFNHNRYCQNMSDAGTVLSTIFKFDEVRVLAGHSGIYLPAGTTIDNTILPKLPPFVELLIYDLQTRVRVLPNVSINKRKRAYFFHHLALMTPAERLAFWLTAELHFEYMGGERTLNSYIGQQYVPNWTTAAKRSTALKDVYLWRSYTKTSLGSQWSYGRNWLSHAPSKLTLKFTEKQSEAYLNITFKWLLYYVILKHTFSRAVIPWNKSPLSPAQPPPMPQNLVPTPVGPAPRPLTLSNHFTVDQLLDTSGSL